MEHKLIGRPLGRTPLRNALLLNKHEVIALVDDMTRRGRFIRKRTIHRWISPTETGLPNLKDALMFAQGVTKIRPTLTIEDVLFRLIRNKHEGELRQIEKAR